MSAAEVARRSSPGASSVRDVPSRRPSPRFLRSELWLVYGRRRNWVGALVLASVPIIIAVAVRLSSPSSRGGPGFLDLITSNGLFVALAGLTLELPLFLPVAVATIAGDAVAGEANLGTLRYLLVVPVDRTRLLAVKYASIVLFGALATLVVAVVGVVTGALLFPVGDVTLLSGDTVPFGEGLLRTLLVAGYVAAALAAVAAVGLLVSTLTEVPIAAMSATVVVVVVLQILDQVPQLDLLDPWLLSHDWLAFGDLLRAPIVLDGIAHGLLVQAGYVVVFLALAWARMTSKDVTS